MYESLADIEALSLECHAEQSKDYIAEAIKCYRAGAYRASIVNTWIALVFDLIDKIRELSLSGDTAASAMQREYERYIEQIERNDPHAIKSALEFERNILAKCRDNLHFFDPQQFVDLSRIHDDRNRCAHPSFQTVGIPFMPSAELARLHIRNAIVHALSQPPVQGKTAVAKLVQLVASEYFPSNTKEATTQLKVNGLNKPSDALVKHFVDTLVLSQADPTNPLFRKFSCTIALKATYDMFPALAEARLRIQINKAINLAPDNAFKFVAILVPYITTFAGDLLDQASVDKLGAFIDLSPDAGVVVLLSTISRLSDRGQQRLNTYDVEGLASALTDSYELSHTAIKPRALELLSQARQWGRVNEIVDKLILPIFPALSREDIIRIINMPNDTGADLRGAHSVPLLMEQAARSDLIPLVELNELLIDNRFAAVELN